MKKEATIRDGINAFAGFPVVLVTTQNNIITVALVHRFSYNPFMLGIGIAHNRYSYKLIEAEGEFIVNIPTAKHLEQVRICGRLSGRDSDKFEATGFTKVPGKVVKSSMIAECPVSIECKVTNKLELDERTWFIGDTVAVYADDEYDVSKSLLCSRKGYFQIGHEISSR